MIKMILFISLIIPYKTNALDLIFNSTFNKVLHDLNDSGITTAANYPNSDNNDCTSNIAEPQDCHQGRDNLFNDNSDGNAGFSFQKIDINGVELNSSAVNWSCVKDLVTGLTWEIKSANASSLHFTGETYRWGGMTHLGSDSGDHFSDWDVLVFGSRQENYCGINNWRVPNVRELQSLVDYSKNGFTIDLTYFPNTLSTTYWTSVPSNNGITGNNTEGARMVDFNQGSLFDFGFRSGTLPVRLVSGEL